MSNIPTQNNNPGDLKDPATGQFQTFASPEEGFSALTNDLQDKINGNTSTGLNGDSTLSDFASVWAPDSDNNNSAQYAANLAKKLGVTTDTPISKLSGRLDDFASAIADNEGYQGPRVLGSTTQTPDASTIKMSPTDFAEKIKAKYPQYANVDDNTLTQKVLAKYPQYASAVDTSGTGSPPPTSTNPAPVGTLENPNPDGSVTVASTPPTPPGPPDATGSTTQPGLLQTIAQNVANPFLQGASSIRAIADRLTGNESAASNIENNGANYGYFGNGVKPVGSGFNIAAPFSQEGQNVKSLLSAAGTGTAVGSDLAGASSLAGGVSGLLSSGAEDASIMDTPQFAKALGGPDADAALADFNNLDAPDQADHIDNLLKNPDISWSDKQVLTKGSRGSSTRCTRCFGNISSNIGPRVESISSCSFKTSRVNLQRWKSNSWRCSDSRCFEQNKRRRKRSK